MNKICGLDIGTTKVVAVIGGLTEAGEIRIDGIGESESLGLRKGVVVNVDRTVDSIERALRDAELMSGLQVERVYTSIAGGHIKGMNSRGVVACGGGREITEKDVDRVIEAAKAVSIPADREVIHIIPREFIVDGQDGIKDPVGMSGIRLEAEVHIVTGAVTSAQNIIHSVNKAGLRVEDIVLEPLASALAALTVDEKDMGCILVDIGGGTTDIAIFIDGNLWHTDVVLVGGENITKDLSVGLHAPLAAAEKIKIKSGAALIEMIEPDEMVEVSTVGSRSSEMMPRRKLVEIINARLEELFVILNNEIKKTGLAPLISGGMVLTGGVASTPGIDRLAEMVLQMPVRVGKPQNMKGIADMVDSPRYSTGVGLLLYARETGQLSPGSKLLDGAMFRSVTRSMRDWFREFIRS